VAAAAETRRKNVVGRGAAETVEAVATKVAGCDITCRLRVGGTYRVARSAPFRTSASPRRPPVTATARTRHAGDRKQERQGPTAAVLRLDREEIASEDEVGLRCLVAEFPGQANRQQSREGLQTRWQGRSTIWQEGTVSLRGQQQRWREQRSWRSQSRRSQRQ
jgi:hypothetical protein